MFSPRVIQLSEDVIKKIAAGEVIHEPVNVVKELLENSIDAKSTIIKINVENGGFTLIQISDNGCGINEDDFSMVCKRHTTSKIQSFADLKHVSTFGFRGEALFSMSCVSNLSIITKTHDSNMAISASFRNGEMLDHFSYVPAMNGTTVSIKDLFYNTLRKQRTIPDTQAQVKSMIKVISKYAVAYPEICFSFVSDKKEKVFTVGSCTEKDVISLIYGVDSGNEVFAHEVIIGKDSKALLFLGSPTSNKQIKDSAIFVNGRLVSCESLRRAIYSVYSTFLMKGEKPFFYAIVSIPFNNVDVNVHPTKKDVVFLNEDFLIEKICDSIFIELRARSKTKNFSTSQITQKGNQAFIDIPDKMIVDTHEESKAQLHEIDDDTSSKYPSQNFIEEEPSEIQDSIGTSIENNCIVENTDPPMLIPSETVNRKSKVSLSNNYQTKIEMSYKSYSLNKPPSTSPPFMPTGSKLSRTDPKFQTLDQMFATSSTPLQPNHKDNHLETNQDIIYGLANQIDEKRYDPLCNIFHSMMFVGFVDFQLILIQSNDTLYACHLFKITRLLFYQLFVEHFGSYGRVEFQHPICIQDLMTLMHDENDDTLSILSGHSDLLNEYFCIRINNNYIESMPIIINGYCPSFALLPLFLYRIAHETDWNSESDCVSSIINELAMLYAVNEEDISDPRSEDIKKQLQLLVIPELKTKSFKPYMELLTDMSISRIRNLNEMYKIFERN